jgi:hypothetical protein
MISADDRHDLSAHCVGFPLADYVLFGLRQECKVYRFADRPPASAMAAATDKSTTIAMARFERRVLII